MKISQFTYSMKKLPLAFLLGLVLWPLIGAIQTAHARDYEVELIVFERIISGETPGESWDFSSERVAAKMQKMHSLAEQAVDFETSEELNHLSAVKAGLASEGYRILHSAQWIQPAEIYQDAPLISFGTEDTTLPFGFIRVYKTSLIFADIDIQLSPISSSSFTGSFNDENTVNDLNSQNAVVEFQQSHFFISEKRRLKFEEVHYFDHPRFGAILGVWPVSEDL
jgi:hypothetical protein